MGAACCKANKTNEKAYIDNTPAAQLSEASSPKEKELEGNHQAEFNMYGENPEKLHQELPFASENVSSTMDPKPQYNNQRVVNQVEKANEELKGESFYSIPDEDVVKPPIGKMTINRNTFFLSNKIEGKDENASRTDIGPKITNDSSHQVDNMDTRPKIKLQKPETVQSNIGLGYGNKISSPQNQGFGYGNQFMVDPDYHSNLNNGIDQPGNPKEDDENDLVLPLYTAPKPDYNTNLVKTDSQGTKNLNFIMEQNFNRNRETTYKTSSSGWLQINYIPEDSKPSNQLQNQTSLPRSRPKVAKFGTIHDEEIRQEIYDKTNADKDGFKDKDNKGKVKISVEIELPNHDLGEFFEASDKLRGHIEKFKKDVVASVSVGKEKYGRIIHNKKIIMQISKPDELYSNTTVDKIRVEVGA